MALVDSHRLTPEDREVWARRVVADPVFARLPAHARRVARSLEALRAFVAAGPCYAGVSWGKDSMVIAHMVASECPTVPLVWVRVRGQGNPDCPAVRDAFLAAHPGLEYHEIQVDPTPDARPGQTSAAGFRIAAERFGDRHISGVRAAESRGRTMRMRVHGESTGRTCAPIGWWPTADVWAYLHAHDLPVHPAYAMSMRGALDRDHLRVAHIGGERGTGRGRREWERMYYRDALSALTDA